MSIQVLPPQLANQIAAGEVVERPASVVKELVENSLDAGANSIDIDIERGGAKLIRIRDNGCGISKDELSLALARHATSKISSLEDLEAILSLGFRGEALASISSVSRLTLTSRTEKQVEGWQAYAEGREMIVEIKPTAHPTGTTVEVLDLFYNTPARRKFMRTEKTEFAHIDEVIRRIALARFDVNINLNHNGKRVRQYRPAKDMGQRERRLATICGSAFFNAALAIEWEHSGLSIHGWVAAPDVVKQFGELQYCYVNGRVMRDRLLNHAIRQAYQAQLTEEQQPAYVLYLNVDPRQVDVNVHPAKHEVRFHQSRLVHDFVYQAVLTVLQRASDTNASLVDKSYGQVSNRQAAGSNIFNTPLATTEVDGEHRQANKYKYSSNYQQVDVVPQKVPSVLYQQLLKTDTTVYEARDTTSIHRVDKAHVQIAVEDEILQKGSAAYSFGRVLTIVNQSIAVVERQEKLALVALVVAERYLKQAQFMPKSEGVRSQPLLIPLTLVLNSSHAALMPQHQRLLEQMGIVFLQEETKLTIQAVPLPLRQQNLSVLFPALLDYLHENKENTANFLAEWLAEQIVDEHNIWSVAQAIQLLASIEQLCPQIVQCPPANLLQFIEITDVMDRLQA